MFSPMRLVMERLRGMFFNRFHRSIEAIALQSFQSPYVTITVFATRVKVCRGRCIGGCGIDTVLCVLGKAMDRFQCTWVAMIGEMYELIVEYLGNGFR